MDTPRGEPSRRCRIDPDWGRHPELCGIDVGCCCYSKYVKIDTMMAIEPAAATQSVMEAHILRHFRTRARFAVHPTLMNVRVLPVVKKKMSLNNSDQLGKGSVTTYTIGHVSKSILAARFAGSVGFPRTIPASTGNPTNIRMLRLQTIPLSLSAYMIGTASDAPKQVAAMIAASKTNWRRGCE
jgi:hypothetical protein